MRASFPAALAALVAATAAPAATLHVCPDGSGEYPNLSAAVAAAIDGDVIELCDGTFSGPDNVDIDVGAKSLTFRSLHGYDATAIDASIWDPVWEEYLPHRGFIVGAATVRFEGFAIVRAGARDADMWSDGGAIQCVGGYLVLDRMRVASGYYRAGSRGTGVYLESGVMSAQDCDFIQNHAVDSGGAIFAENSHVELVRCHFAGNAACVGGACIHFDGGSIVDCVLESGGGGGCEGSNPGGNAIAVAGGSVLMRGTTVANSHHVEAGAIIVHSGAVVDIDECLVEGCSSAYFAGAALFYGTATVRNTVFRDNFGASYGGTDVASYGHVLLDHCVFLNTRMHDAPQGNGIEAGGELVVRNCVFAGQSSYGGSRTIDGQEGVDLTIENTILAFGGRDGAPQAPVYCSGAPRHLDVRCNDIYGNAGGDWVGCLEGLAGQDGNLGADPLFCDWAAGDLELRAASPCAPAHSGDCGQIGAFGVGCGTTAFQPSSWGQIKEMYR